MNFQIDMIYAIILFAVGLYGVTTKTDFLKIFFSLEMLLNAVILVLASSAYHFGMTRNLSIAYVIIVIATLEAGAGILIFLLSNRITHEVIPDNLNEGGKYDE
jgi:NADH:ubiquinone oxidoreductase subunit K